MFEMIEKSLLIGIGALSLTQKKAEELIDELQKQFNISEEKGRDLLTKLQETAKENQARLEEVAREEVRKASERLGLVTQDEFEKLRYRIQMLEKQIELVTAEEFEKMRQRVQNLENQLTKPGQ